jgi:hypothetical protein
MWSLAIEYSRASSNWHLLFLKKKTIVARTEVGLQQQMPANYMHKANQMYSQFG